MIRVDDTLWQFRIHTLLTVTAVVSAITWGYVSTDYGFFLALALSACCVAVVCRRRATDRESRRIYGILGSIAGGAFAGICQVVVMLVRAERYELEGFSLPFALLSFCPVGAIVGAFIGLFAWEVLNMSLGLIQRLCGRPVLTKT